MRLHRVGNWLHEYEREIAYAPYDEFGNWVIYDSSKPDQAIVPFEYLPDEVRSAIKEVAV